MLSISKPKRSPYIDIPKQIYDLGADIEFLMDLSKYINLESEAELSCYDRYIYDNLLIILNAEDTDANKLWYIKIFVANLCPLQ